MNKVTKFAKICPTCGDAFVTILRRPAKECLKCRKKTQDRKYHNSATPKVKRLRDQVAFHKKKALELEEKIRELEANGK